MWHSACVRLATWSGSDVENCEIELAFFEQPTYGAGQGL